MLQTLNPVVDSSGAGSWGSSENGKGTSWQVHREHVMTECMYQQEEEGMRHGQN